MNKGNLILIHIKLYIQIRLFLTYICIYYSLILYFHHLVFKKCHIETKNLIKKVKDVTEEK